MTTVQQDRFKTRQDIFIQVEAGLMSAEAGNLEYETLEQNSATRAEQAKAKYQAVENREKENFVMQDMKGLTPIYEQLSPIEAGVFFRLICELRFNQTQLKVNSRGMKIEDMRNIVNNSEGAKNKQIPSASLKRYIGKFIKLGLMTKTGNTKGSSFHINPKYVVKGGYSGSLAFCKVYQEPSKSCFNMLDIQTLGFFIKLSMYVNMKTLFVVSNPLETEVEKIQPLKVKDIQVRMGMGEDSTRKYIKALGSAGILWDTGRAGSTVGRVFYLHPEVIYRGKKDGGGFTSIMEHFAGINQLKEYTKKIPN